MYELIIGICIGYFGGIAMIKHRTSYKAVATQADDIGWPMASKPILIKKTFIPGELKNFWDSSSG